MELVSVVLIEKDRNADILMTWSYPCVPEGTELLVLPKLGLIETTPPEFLFIRFKDHWAYSLTVTGDNFPGLQRVSALTVVLFARGFNPEKYKDLTGKFSQLYGSSGDPTLVLQAYLSIMGKETFDFGSLGKFSTSDYDDRRAMMLGNLKDIISTFGMETILIYNAVILKKRIIVFSSKLSQLISVVRTLPALAWHRQNWSILRPYVLYSEVDFQDLSTSASYIAGFTDRTIENREDLYDLFIDVDDRSVTVAPNAKNDFLMGKPHKELAQFMISISEDPANNSEQQLIKAISQRTKQLLSTLESFLNTETGKVTVEEIKAKELPTALARFFWNLAIAEDCASL